MVDQKKLERWTEKLLDTGKRNNLIDFKDSKSSSAEVIAPSAEKVFSNCVMGHSFDVFDPKITVEADEEVEEFSAHEQKETSASKGISREEYQKLYHTMVRSERFLCIYGQTPDPLAAVKKIAKKAASVQEETGVNVSYFAFGFVNWKEKEDSKREYQAPLLLVHIKINTGAITDPITIEVSDDDMVVNPTFDYLLQAEYGQSLPVFEEGDTFESYITKVERIVRRLGWKVSKACKLGIFSFQKINMYEDLKKNEDLVLQNGNIRALLGESTVEVMLRNLGGEGGKVENPLIDLHTVVEADSSQIEAIEMAKSGRSFVLQGPPGTGKSQTITNIVAECLHDGKKVLFVSEKQAALNVVFDKLKQVGLADFCLELHSHKANKRAVIEELNRTLDAPIKFVSSSVENEIRQKRAAQEALDQYARELHKKRDYINKSLYQLFELYSAQRTFPEVPVSLKNYKQQGEEYFIEAERLIGQYADYIPSIGSNYRKNAWYGFIAADISFEERNLFQEDLELLVRGYKSLQETTVQIKAKYETPELNFNNTMRWKSLLSFSAASDVITPALLARNACEYAQPFVSKLKNLSEMIVPLRDDLYKVISPEAVDVIDGTIMNAKLNNVFSSFLSRLFSSEYKSLVGTLQQYLKVDGKIKYQQAVELSEQLMQLQALMKEYEEAYAPIQGYLGTCYKGTDTDWSHVISEMQTLQDYYNEDSKAFGALSEMSATEFSQKQAQFREDAGLLESEIKAIKEAKERVGRLFASEVLDLETDSYDYCVRKLENCLNEFNKLGNWISFLELLGRLNEKELMSFVENCMIEDIAPEEIVGAYRRGFYKQWIDYTIYNVPVLRSFTRINQDQTVTGFVNKDKLQYEISKQQIIAELSQNRPNLNMVAAGSPVAIIRREGQKKRRQMPIRRLLSETGSFVQAIKPCFLMSPLSVSTYLDPERLSFDTVIFDEASQIFPQDAMGAIYRGKQIIVVGDSKQMPPSNFFNALIEMEENEEDYDDISDFESILDVCSATFDTERLAWHYRSHYEQLIAFSNLNFYNNNLVTFPSSATDHKGIGVDYYYIDGTFDRKKRTNQEEARFIVELIYQNIKEYPNRSLGVVAFSVAQQDLIDKLLSKRREEDQSCEWFFADDKTEPFFIKNLETVQGDERDTIIFSVAYAKDSTGRFIQNFGPLNKEGGERRLNVAITRAKENVQLVASIRYTDINLSNTGSEGVRLLRAYLDYAQNGARALNRAITVQAQDCFDSYFEQEVCDFLRDHGMTVDTQVGCSGYRIDLGLRVPDSSNYVLAIECDGATYHSSKNARDRDSLRQSVLEKMGWQFYRIWSTDWYRNKVVEKERLLEAAKKALHRYQHPIKKPVEKVQEAVSKAVQEKFVKETQVQAQKFPEYKTVNAMEAIYLNGHSIPKAVREVLLIEAPLSEDYLLKRIVSYFGREKVTKVVKDEYQWRMRQAENYGIIRKDGFLYLKDMGEIKLRVPGEKRDIKYISKEELADGLLTLVKQNYEASKSAIYKILTNSLGFNRTTEAIIAKYDEALLYLKEKGAIVEEGGMLALA